MLFEKASFFEKYFFGIQDLCVLSILNRFACLACLLRQARQTGSRE